MQIINCLCVEHSDSEFSELNRVLCISKSIMAITIPMPKLSWNTKDGQTMITGTDQELDMMKIILQQNLGLFKEEDSHPFDYALNSEPNYSGVSHEQNAIDYLSLLYSATPLDSEGNPDLNARRTLYEIDNDRCTTTWIDSVEVSNDAEWISARDRLHDAPNPTESASGSVSIEEQIRFSEAQNPRHWNIVKATYGGSRYYLSYICPPSVNIFSTLRVVGGLHQNDTPEILDICPYNTESYWRELRHMMHQEVEFIREAVPA